MARKCRAALITCEDFRLNQRDGSRNYIAEFIKKLETDCDLITRAGGVQDIVRPEEQGFLKSLLRDIRVSVELHEVKTIHLVNHEDCGAYSFPDSSSRKEKLEQHKKDLQTAREIILKEFSGIEVKLYLAELEPETEDVFVIKGVDCLPKRHD